MTKYLDKTFSVSVASGGISEEELARRQKAAGADALDLNIGPQKKAACSSSNGSSPR